MLEPPPAGYESWDEFYRAIGVPEEELCVGADSIADPDGEGRASGSRSSPTPSRSRTACISTSSSGEGPPDRGPPARVDAEATRLAGLGATGTGALSEEGLDHYAVAMDDPEGNEFDIN